MKFEFENTINEYIELQLYLKENDIKQKIFFLFLKYFFILFCIIEAIKYFIKHEDLSKYLLLIFFIVIIFLWIIIVPKLISNATKRATIIMIKKNPKMLERKVMMIVDNEIILSDIEDNIINRFNIDDIYNVVELRNSLYIFKDKFKVDLIIPLDEFKNELDKDKDKDKDKVLNLLRKFKIEK